MDLSQCSGVTLQQFEVFLAAARHENFTKAANELHMTQASVSRNIAALERELGLILFIRFKRRVRLTPAGRVAAEGLRGIMGQLDVTLEKALEAQRCQYDTLHIGDYNTTPEEAYLFPILERFERENPKIEVQITRADPLGVRDGLMEGHYDAVFYSVAGQASFEDMDLEFTKILSLAPCIVISKRHRLFEREDVTFRDFCGDPIITMASGPYSLYWEYARRVFEQNGFSLDRVKYVDNPHTIATELQRGGCIALMDRLFAPSGRDELRYIEIPDCEKGLGFGIAWSRDNPNPSLRKFVDCAKRVRFPDGAISYAGRMISSKSELDKSSAGF